MLYAPPLRQYCSTRASFCCGSWAAPLIQTMGEPKVWVSPCSMHPPETETEFQRWQDMNALDTCSTQSSNQSNTHRVRGRQLHGWQFSRGSLLSSCLDPSRGQPGAGELHKPWEQDLRSEISWKLKVYWKSADRGGLTGDTLVVRYNYKRTDELWN